MHVPYGYRIVDGKAVVDEVQAEQVRSFFNEYLSGKSLQTAAENAGLKITHSSAGKMLRNAHYLGDDYYPAIIEEALFGRVEQERQTRATRLGRGMELAVGSEINEREARVFPKHFIIGRQTEHYDNPYRQAEYIYSLIESEDNTDGNDTEYATGYDTGYDK